MDDIIRPKKRPITNLEPKPSLAVSNTPSVKKSVEISEPAEEEPDFKTPEQVADEDIMTAAKTEEPAPTAEGPTKKINKNRKKRFNLHMPHGKKQWIITILVIIALLAGGASAYWFGFHKTAKPTAVTNKPTKKAVVKPTTEVSTLSGLTVPIGTNLNPVTAIQIENSPDARPQAGLKEASIIFEAIAEGGITRFNAIFQDTAPDYVGPIRSLRPYYIDWFWPFDAAIAHVGGAPQALSDIKTLGIKDLDQFYNGNSYDRINSRYAPHNVYTSIARLNDLEKSKGFNTSTYKGFARKKEEKAVTPTAKTIDLSVSGFYYNVHYDYDAAKNAYLRNEGGEPHKDDRSGSQLEPKVVVAIVMSRGLDGDGEHTDYQTTGSGHMFVFQDGNVQEGTWGKTARKDQWTFTATDGKPITFNPGQTWFTMVDSTGSVTYSP